MLRLKIIKQETEPKAMAEKYISALYGCSLVEFARQIEFEKNKEETKK